MTSRSLQNQTPEPRAPREAPTPYVIDREPIRPELLAIAISNLGERFAVLDERGSDSLDFHDAGVVGVRDALEAAYRLGLQTRAELGDAMLATLELVANQHNPRREELGHPCPCDVCRIVRRTIATVRGAR